MEDITITGPLADLLLQLANEDGVTPEDLVATLTRKEDRKRHVKYITIQKGDHRFQCERGEKCFEVRKFLPRPIDTET